MNGVLLAAIPLLVFDLSLDDGDFVATGNSDQWEWGRVDTGPPGDGRAWATLLGEPYRHNGSDFLEILLALP